MNSYGICLLDTLSGKYGNQLLKDKFANGLEVFGTRINLENIYLYGFTTDNASHFTSAMDIVLGTFRYYVNRVFDKPMNEKQKKTCDRLMFNIIKMTQVEGVPKTEYYTEYPGIMLRPKGEIRVDDYAVDYAQLNAFLSKYTIP